MKKTAVISLLLLVFVAAAAQDKISHPSLLFTPSRVEAAKRRIQNDTVQRNAYNSIILEADKNLNDFNMGKMQYLALAYQLTGKKKYSDKLKTMLLEISGHKDWANMEMMLRKPAWHSELQMAHRAFQVAVSYDAVYNDLKSPERRKIADGMYRLAVEPLLGDWLTEPARIHSLNSMGHNWWSSCVGMGGLLALAISNENPEAKNLAKAAVEALPEWFDFAGDVLQQKPKTFDRNGGMYESVNYASFGITEALLLRLAWLNAHPDDKLEEIPQMGKLADFFCQVGYPRSEGIFYSINFGDSHKNVTGESSMILAYAMGERNPDVLWYINSITPGQHREGYPRTCPMGFLYTPDLSKAPELPSASKDRLWKDFGWVTMRDSYEPNSTMLAAKCGMTWNHAHADAGSLILFHKGEDIIKDAGNCWYAHKAYRNYFFQSDAHNVVKFNGKGQSTYQQYHGTMLPGTMTNLISGDRLKYVLANATGPTSDNFARNFRHYLWVDDVILIIDDLKSHEYGEYEWLWHPGGESRKVGGSIEITKNKSSVVLTPLFPQPLAPSNFVHDYPQMMYWEEIEAMSEDLKTPEKYYSFKLPGKQNRMKGVTAITLKETPGQKELPRLETRSGEGWIGVRITSTDGKVTNVYINELADGRTMHLNSWINADGYDTDAYLLVVGEDKTFIGYGSSLRKEGKSIFSSLSKLNFLSENEGNNVKICIEGQPRINATYQPTTKIGKATINGKNTTTTNGTFRIKLNNVVSR